MPQRRAPFYLSILFSPFTWAAPDPAARVVSVSGACLRSVEADRFSITATAQVLARSAAEASARATDSYEKFRQELKQLNLKNLELQTSELRVEEAFEWENNKNVSKGFRSRMGLNVSTSEKEQLGRILKLATDKGLTEIGALQSQLSPEKLKSEEEKCLAEAMKNARSKAATLAQAGGATLGRVHSIRELRGSAHDSAPPGVMMKAAMADGAGGGAPSLEVRDQKIAVSVEVVYSLQ